MKYRKITGYLAVFITAAVLTGCGASQNYKETSATESISEEATEDIYEDVDSYAPEMMEESNETTGESEAKADSGSEQVPQESVASNRKLIKTIDLELETLNYEKTIALLEKSVSECGGYIENSELEGNSIYSSYSLRYGSFKVRIPKDKADSFVKGMDENTTVRRKSESTEDITLEYVDTESHKEALKVEQERLMAILEKAETVEDIISLESRLSEVRYELGNYESTLRTYDNLVDYTTIYIQVNEVEEVSEPQKQTAVDRMISGFKGSVKSIGRGIKEFIIAVVIHIPYLVVWAVIIGAVIFVVRVLRKRRKKKTK